MGFGSKYFHIIILCNVVTLGVLETWLHFQKDDSYLANSSFLVQQNTLIQQCARLCTQFPICVSVSVLLNTLQCRLNYVTKEDFPELMKHIDGQRVVYMEKKEFSKIFNYDVSQTRCQINSRYFAALKRCLPHDFGSIVNISVGKNTSLSSTAVYEDYDFGSDKTVDGNWGTHALVDGCAITSREENPWWIMDLQYPYIIQKITLAIRRDYYWQAFRNAKMMVGMNATSLEICGTFDGPATRGQFVNITCGVPIVGDLVKIMLIGESETLTLCEVGVFAYQWP